MSRSKILLLSVFAVAIAAFFLLDLQNYLTLDALQEQHAAIQAWRSTHPGLVVTLYALIYIVVTALALPGAAVMTLAGGQSLTVMELSLIHI